MRAFKLLIIVLVIGVFVSPETYAQTTSWVGITSTWKAAANWTNGVPDATKDAVIGDASWVGLASPILGVLAGSAECKNLIIGNSGIAITAIIDNDLTVYGNVLVGANGTLSQSFGSIVLTGNWINNGLYTTILAGRKVYFSGTSQSISGTSLTTFENVYVNTGSTVTLARNTAVSSGLTINGTFDPTEAFTLSGSGSINVSTDGVLRVKATTFAGNYPGPGSTTATTATSTIDYASSINNQSVSPTIAYRRLVISGSTIKTSVGNLTIANSLAVTGGTFNMGVFTANRTTGGGSLSLAAGTTLRIGGTGNTFPTNYTTRSLSPTSTVEYFGGNNQTISAQTYGHLIISSVSGAVNKNMPGTAFTVAGNFSTTVAAGTLTFTAGNNISVLGNVNLGANSTFTATGFTHSFGGNWTNNGTFAGCGSSMTSTGSSSQWSGAGSSTFGTLIVTGNGTVVDHATSINVCTAFSTSGGGSFTHTTGGVGVFSMTTVAAKTIGGSNIIFDDLTVAAGSVATTSSFVVAGDLSTAGSLSATAGTISMTGTTKTISGAGAIQFAGLNIPGSVSLARDISISANFAVAGTYAQSSNTTFFNGTSTFSGTASVFAVQISAASSLTMGGSATLLVASTQTLGAGASLNTSSNTPNTIHFNSPGAQAITFTGFNNMIVSGGNTKTPSAGLTISGNLTIQAATTLAAGTFTHNLAGNFVNAGTFTPGTSTVQLNGTGDASITGVTSFNNLTVNKTIANVVALNNNIDVINLAMTAGKMLTLASSVTITATRTGPGIIMGTITRTHAFAPAVDYAFEGPDNFVRFATVGSVTSITVIVQNAPVTNFPSGVAINRRYNVAVTGAGYTATWRMHYEQAEVNGNAEAGLTMWNDQNINVWINLGQTAVNTGDNWVEHTGLTSIVFNWTLSDGQNLLSWNGSVSSAWEDPLNWTITSGAPGPTPTLNSTVQIGNLPYVNQPVISTNAQAKGVTFYSITPGSLTINSGQLVVQGNIQGSWAGNATHTINVGTRSLSVFSDMILSDGVAGHAINLNVSSGSVSVTGSLVEAGSSNITYSAAGDLSLGKDFTKTGGTFTAGTGSVTYNGASDQVVANVAYNDLIINKVSGLASTATPITVGGSLNVTTVGSGGQLILGGSMTVANDISISSNATLNAVTSDISLGGNWALSGTFIPGTGNVIFTGTTAQVLNATTFNNLIINKASNTITLTGDLSINGDVNVQAGTLDVNTRNIIRTTTGGLASLGASAVARFSGASQQFLNFAALNTHTTSTTEFYGTAARPIPPISYGNLIITNGGSNAKSMVGPTEVKGDLTVNAGASLNGPPSTLDVWGNVTAMGTLDLSAGTMIFDGTSKNIASAGVVTYNNVVVNGSYTVTTGGLNFIGHLQINGNLNLGGATVTSSGDLTNSGVLFSSGNVTFLGTQVQTIRLLNAVSSTSTGIINFNGTIAPVLNSNSSPVFATVNINNTAGINTSESWTVGVAMNVAAGSTWNGGSFTHNFLGNFANNGTVTSAGNMNFAPPGGSVNVNLGTTFTSNNKVTFGGAGVINLSGAVTNFRSIDITNSNAAGITPPVGWILSENLLIGANSTFNGGTALSHTMNGTWTNNGTFNGGTSTVSFGSTSGADQLTGSGVNNFNNILFPPAAQLVIIAPVRVSGNWTNNGTAILLQFGKVTFNGTGTSLINGSTVTTFAELEVNKGAGSVQMDLDANVNSTVQLTAGPLRLNARRLTVSNSLNTAITRTAGYVVSESTVNASRLDWTIGTDATAHIFPFGTSTGTYIPFTFILTSGTAGTVSTATYGAGADNYPLPPGVGHIGDAAGNNNAANTVDRFYQIDLTGSTVPVATLTFTAAPAEVGSITNLVAQRWNGANWDAPLPGQVSTATTATVSNVAQFSPWTMSGNLAPLPIELSSFTGELGNNQVILKWTTASELNNDYFEVQKSTNGRDFVKLSSITGAGTTNEQHAYLYKDYEIKSGRLFYRLKQVDYDKTFSYSNVVVINVGEVEAVVFTLSPNPVVDQFYISSNSNTLEPVSVTVFDGTGRVALKSEHNDFGHDAMMAIDAGLISPGMYVVHIRYRDEVQSFRILKRD